MSTPKTLHQILFEPNDVLFFRDGRPMSGSLAGHTAAWPLPDVTSHALHAALHRAGLDGVHTHRRGRSGQYAEVRDRKFGSLATAGPFPVKTKDEQGHPLDKPVWYFPRPKDTLQARSVEAALRPVRSLEESGEDHPWLGSSLPDPLEYAVANTQPPTKETTAEPWISAAAYKAYLRAPSDQSDPPHYLPDTDLADTEQTIGIGIDPETQTQDQTNFYSAHYLRLRDGFRLGLFAEAMDKLNGDPNHRRDLLRLLLNDHPQSVVVGGQQRICTASRSDAPDHLPLPHGLAAAADFKQLSQDKYAVKWILLTPAIWPEMQGENIVSHPGGWLPNWVDPETGAVLLKAGDTTRQPNERRDTWRQRVRALPAIAARLVAAIVPKAIPVTGWALGVPDASSEISSLKSEIQNAGAKSTHLAVPAGAVYYFEADTSEAAAQLAAALNWHGAPLDRSNPSNPSGPATIRNRRSTLLGEKGYGLGVCGTWEFFNNVPGRPNS